MPQNLGTLKARIGGLIVMCSTGRAAFNIFAVEPSGYCVRVPGSFGKQWLDRERFVDLIEAFYQFYNYREAR